MKSNITIWEIFDKETEDFVHNHIEDGWAETDKPVPKFNSQKGWTKMKWRKEHAHLVDGKVEGIMPL